MATYAIGDVQGCFEELEKLLSHIQFHPDNDTLWFTGDLVNRGPKSLEVLRFVKSLGDKHIVVLGNHDLHLLAVYYGLREKHSNDTLNEFLNAADKDELITWLQNRPLLHHDKSTRFVMTHAGLAPAWSLDQAIKLANEVEIELRHSPEKTLKNMFGNYPDLWEENLSGAERIRCIINYFTRMRFCYSDGRLNFSYKGRLSDKPHELTPWFDVPHRLNADEKIIFGHWAALGGEADVANVYPLDTGCVWGNCLTAMRLDDKRRFAISCA